jgi:DNA-binding FadR family transcriptional regulator
VERTLVTITSPLAIKRHRLSDQIANQLEQMILSGEMAIGETLPSERDLMERFQVGRPAVREALLWLSKKGLISISGGERARVTEPDPKDLIEHLSTAALLLVSRPEGMQVFQQARLFTEVALTREAARAATNQELDELEKLLRANEATRGDVAEFARTDDDFHFGVARISHNTLVTALYNSVLAVLENQRHTSLKHSEALEAAIGCHRRIFEAIAARDPDKAEMEMRRHLGDVETYYWSVRSDRAAKAKP